MRKLVFVTLLLLCSSGIFAQMNLSDYDSKPVHWGFSFGANKLDFLVFKTQDFANQDSIMGIAHSWMPSGHLSPSVSVRMTDFVEFRFLVNLTFQRRLLNYYMYDGTVQKIEVNSTLLQAPIMFKFRGDRQRNVKPYVITGIAPTFDLSANKRLYPDQPHVYLTPEDIYAETGLGFDFYLQYFKLSTEIKFGYGMFDVLVHDPNYLYTRYLDRLHSYYFMFTLHFEG